MASEVGSDGDSDGGSDGNLIDSESCLAASDSKEK